MVKHPGVSTTAFLLVLLGIGSTYWILNWAMAPHAALDQRILFKPNGDGDYLPQVAALSRLHLRETTVRELAHTGVHSFPFAALVLHAALVRLFGNAGMVLAEILVFLLYGYLLSRFLQNTGIARGVARILAVTVVSGAAGLVVANSSRIIGSFPLAFWSSRFPRPSVTEIFVVILLIFLIRLVDSRGPGASDRDWLVTGIAGGCLLQADIYPALALAIASGVIVAYLLVRDYKRTLRGLCFAAPAAAVVSIPFLYQRIHELPDVPRRFGMFALQGHHWFMFIPLRLFVIIFLWLLVAAAYWFRSPAENRAGVRATVAVMGIVVVVSAFTGPLSLFVFGKGIQIYHYSITAQTMAGYAVLIAAGWVLQDVLGRTRVLFHPRFMALATGAVFAACLAVAGWLCYRSMGQVWWGRTQPAVADPRMRNRFDRAEESRYRSSFNELDAMFARPEWKGAEVLGTFDGELANWWQYRSKYLYLPDVFNSTVSDSEIESRIDNFMHLLETTPQEFSRTLDNWFFLMRVLAAAKYHANMMYAPWPLQAYSREAQARIRRSEVLAGTNLELPEPEKARLMDAYTQFDPLKQPARKLDVIVLSTGALRQYVHPERSNLKLVWQNRVFEVWVPENRGISSAAQD